MAEIILVLLASNFVLVKGNDGGGNEFFDVVICDDTGSATTLHSSTTGSPATRTYSIASFFLKLAMGSGNYIVRALGLGLTTL